VSQPKKILVLWYVFAQKENPSGVVSVQVIDKSRDKYQVIKTIGSSSDAIEIENL
jgi:hypothetical protein